MLSYREALTRATDQLSANPQLRPSALADAALLLMHCLGIDRPTLIAHPERAIDREQQAAFQRLIERRLTFEPIQYITGTQEFYGLALRVNSAVLIPRPETELLVEATLARLPHDQPLHIADVGTGSGAIAIALATHLPLASVTAIDLSSEALAIAQENIAMHDLSARILCLQSDLFGSLPPHARFDAIVSNPPYAALADAPMLHPQVRDHEPAEALFAGESGLDIYRRLIPQAHCLLNSGGLFALELGQGQADAVRVLLASWQDLILLDDLQHIPRVALARRI